jgi:hypothetical protein
VPDELTLAKEERDLDRLLLQWKEQESIAMHFNDLIARFRVQALGGTATIGAVAALITSKTQQNEATFFAVVAFLFVGWTALWALDYGYYQKLLDGAVRSLLRLEQQLPEHSRMSTSIEAAFTSPLHGHLYFYSFIQVALAALVVVAFDDARAEDSSAWWCWVVVVACTGWTFAAIRFAGRRPFSRWREKRPAR